MEKCFTTEDDERLARGWPHLIVPVDGLKADKTAAAAEKAWYASDPIFFTEWPRKTLHRFLRFSLTPWKAHDDAVAKAALANDTQPSAEECLEGLRNRVRAGITKPHPFTARNLVWGVEAIAGTDATLEMIASEMETTYPKLPEHAGTFEHVVSATAFMLLRASPAVAKSARERMERLFAAHAETQDEEVESYFGAIDFVLHGAAGVKRFCAKYPTWTVWLEVAALYCVGSLDYAGDEPAFIRRMITTTDPKLLSDGMSVRVAALGGSEALALLPKRKWPAVQMPAVVRDFGMLRAPEVVSFMASLLGKSSVKDGAMSWLKTHADYARPILERAKTDVAKLALRQL